MMTRKIERKDGVHHWHQTAGETSTPIHIFNSLALEFFPIQFFGSNRPRENVAKFYTGIFKRTCQPSHQKWKAIGPHFTPSCHNRNLHAIAKFDTLHENLKVARSRMSLPDIQFFQSASDLSALEKDQVNHATKTLYHVFHVVSICIIWLSGL